MKTNSIYAVLAAVAGILLVGYLFARTSCAGDIDFTPASRVDLGLIEGSQGETYKYNSTNYSSKGDAVAACVANKLNF